MDQLPVDVLIDILLRLPIKSLLRCRCVSKPFLNLTHLPQFTHTQLSRSPQINHPNLLVIGTSHHHPTGLLNTVIWWVEPDYAHLDRYTSIQSHFSAPDFKQFRVVGSCNGLLCLVHHMFRHIIYVCNPFTGDYIRVPDPIEDEDEMVIGFGFSPEFDEYKVVQIVSANSIRAGYSQVFVFTLGDDRWRDWGEVGYTFRTKLGAGSGFVNGALHWVCSSSPANLIVSFDVGDEVFGVIPRPKEFGEEKSCCSLGVLNGCLSITDSSFGDRVEIWVMGDYGVEGSWTKRFTISSQAGWSLRFSQTLWFQRDGKILFFGGTRNLLLYDPQTGRLNRFRLHGFPPSWSEAVTHVASLVSPSRCLPRGRQLRNADGNSMES